MSDSRRLALVVAGWLSPALAYAGNGGHPRTPVEWPADVPCMTVVDRSQSAMLHLPYGIIYEDTELTTDELPTSRRHQFVAFCRNHSPQEPVPTWLSWQDVGVWNDWLMSHQYDPLVLTDPEVLETNALYKDCFVRMTPDDARRPITYAEADKGVDWDTTGLAPGAYVISGYTWEPGINIWSQRRGVVHVVDGPDLAAVGPAAALADTPPAIGAHDTTTLEGCARALPGSTLTAYWSDTELAELDWQMFAEAVPLDGEAIALPFTPPPGAIEKTIALRVDITDPMQRTYSAYPLQLLVVLGEDIGTTSGCDGNSFLTGGCGETSDEGTSEASSGGPTGGTSGGATSSSTSSSSSSTTAPLDPADAGGCGCSSNSGAGWGFAAVLALFRRRRRSGHVPKDRAAS